MPIGLNKFITLSKLTISSGGDSFEAMFNPESYSEVLSFNWNTENGIDSGTQKVNLESRKPQSFKLKLILDSTGVTEFMLPPLNMITGATIPVHTRVNRFLSIAWDAEKNMANPLTIKWGEFVFNCWLKELNITYSLFDRDGTPLRADLDVTFIENIIGNAANYKRRLNPGKAKASSASAQGTSGSSDSKKLTIKIS